MIPPARKALARHLSCRLLSFLLCFPLRPPAAVWSPQGFCGMWGQGRLWLSLCVQEVFWELAGLVEGVWVSLQGGRHARTWPRV